MAKLSSEEIGQRIRDLRAKLISLSDVAGLPNKMKREDWTDFKRCWDKFSENQKRHYLATALGQILIHKHLENTELEVALVAKFSSTLHLENYTDTEKRLIAKVVRDSRRYAKIADYIVKKLSTFAEYLYQSN